MSRLPYYPGTSKGQIRDNVFLYFMHCSNILTLPNLYFDLEKMFIKDGKKVTSIENNYEIYIKQLNLAPIEMEINYSDIKNFDVSKYDGIFLDFCGLYNQAASNVFRKIKPKTKIAVTFIMARESKLLQQVIDITNRKAAYITLLANYNILVTKCVEYCDSSPMCVFFGEKQ